MLILLIGIFVLHITSFILLLVATIENAWWTTDTISTDIWSRWTLNMSRWTSGDLPDTYPSDYLQAVQASSVLACVFSAIGLLVFVLQLFTLPKGRRFTFTGIFQLLACLCIMIAASIYTDIFHKIGSQIDQTGQYGASFIIAWISFSLTFISCIIYFVLRKKAA